ncbi:unnamed protein product [Pleuronectes platessa]|uniref:Uncharacterized protein n=1 Tax=Pleuronectes platessa TaxID=8262 RepID=A0A9N7Y5X7_PLEPL|nr:unnamed protein product [Pleuronectes platessa]
MATENMFPRVTQEHLLQDEQHPGRLEVSTIEGGSSLCTEITACINKLQQDLHRMEEKYKEEKAEKVNLKTLLHTLITSSQNVPCIQEIIEGPLFKKRAEFLKILVSQKIESIIKEKDKTILCLNTKITELECCNNQLKQSAFFPSPPAESYPFVFDKEKLLRQHIQDLKEQLQMEISDNEEKTSEYEEKISKDRQKLSGYEQKVSADKQKISDYEKKIQDLKEQLQMELRKSAASADKKKVSAQRSDEEPEVSNEEPEVSDEEPEVSDEEPEVEEVEVEEPETKKNKKGWKRFTRYLKPWKWAKIPPHKPEVSGEEPEVEVEEPDVSDEEPEVEVDERPETKKNKKGWKRFTRYLKPWKWAKIPPHNPEVSSEETEVSYEGSEGSYEEPEVSCEGSEGSYQEPEVSYEEAEVSYEGSEGSYEGPEVSYEGSEVSYEGSEVSDDEPEEDTQRSGHPCTAPGEQVLGE